MSMITSVTHAAANLASGLESITTPPPRTAPRSAELARLPSAGRLDLLGAKATAPKTAPTKTTAPKTTPTKAAAPKTAPTKTTAKKSTAGYATTGSDANFAFLKDPTLSVEEKLFRFMCAIAKQNDDAVLKKMEEMKGGTAAKAAAKTSTSTAAKKSSGLSVWGALKVVLPALGITAEVLGDAKVKSMVTQLSGPVLAAGATALGMPALAPLALSAGPGLTGAILDGKLGTEAAGAVSSSSSGSDGTTSTPTSTSGSSGSGQNEQVQLMELQRLIDKQKEMFAMVSNILRAQHDTRMSIIGNVR